MPCVYAQPLSRWHWMLQARSQGGVYGSLCRAQPPRQRPLAAQRPPLQLGQTAARVRPFASWTRAASRPRAGKAGRRPSLPTSTLCSTSAPVECRPAGDISRVFARPTQRVGYRGVEHRQLRLAHKSVCSLNSVQRDNSKRSHRIATSLAAADDIERSTISASKQATRSTAYYSEASASQQSQTTSPIRSARLR